MAFATLAVLIVVAYFLWPKFAAICPSKEVLSVCSRAWLSALSGYFATAAAVGTVVLLYRQNAGQQRTAEFALGDADPSMDAIQHIHSTEKVVIRIANWNRRPIVVQRLRIVPPVGAIEFAKVEITNSDTDEGLKRRRLVEEAVTPAIPMHGWKNRGKAPCELRLDVRLISNETARWSDRLVKIDILIAGERQEKKTLTSAILIADFSDQKRTFSTED